MRPVIKTTFKALGDKSVTDYCRWLIEANVDPSSKLEVWRDTSTEADLIVNPISEGAKWKLKGEQYIPYRMPFKRGYSLSSAFS